MRVLLLHNRYRAQGGEERAVSEITGLLERRGHVVEVLERDSSTVARSEAARAMLHGGEDPEAVGAAVRRMQAEVVHAHNLHPLFGWRALAAAREAGARTVLHLHNYRLYCAIGVAYRAGAPCHQCHGQNTLPGLLHRCRGSVREAAVYAAGLSLQLKQMLEHTDSLIVLSEQQRALLRGQGLPEDGISVVPNFIPDPGWARRSRAGEGEYALFVGRLVEEKGADTAIVAAKVAGVPLVLAGSGPDERRLRRLAEDADVTFAGWVDAARLAELRERAALLLAPSRWEEVCPYSVLEAIAAGLPVLASDRGGLPELVHSKAGLVLPADDAGAWATALRTAWGDPAGRRSGGEAALLTGRERFGEELAYKRLIEVLGGG